jgi:hypothetical protein
MPYRCPSYSKNVFDAFDDAFDGLFDAFDEKIIMRMLYMIDQYAYEDRRFFEVSSDTAMAGRCAP